LAIFCTGRGHNHATVTSGAWSGVIATKGLVSKNPFVFLSVGIHLKEWAPAVYDRNLVDPASSHMLVSKIKPCMSKYKHFIL
jgi:hypothetical protein